MTTEKRETTNLEWLNSISPIKDQPWQHEKVIRIAEIDNIQFYQRDCRCYRAVMNPQDIQGIDYAYEYNFYEEITWLQLLNSLKRFDWIKNNKNTYEALVEHIQNDYQEAKLVEKYGDVYITGKGQHRLALAKFLGLAKIEVNIQEYPFAQAEYQRYLSRKFFLGSMLQEGLINDQTYQWNLNNDCPAVFIEIDGKSIDIDEEVMLPFYELYKNLKVSPLLRIIDALRGSNIPRYNNRVKDILDIKKYKPFLRKQKHRLMLSQ